MDSTLNPCSDDCEKAKAFRRTLDRHRERLQNEIQLSKLRPYLLKRAVLSQGEFEQLSNCPPAQRNEELLKTLYGKPNTAMLEFVCCLKEIPKHAELAKLFDQSPGPSSEDSDDDASMQCEYRLTSDRLAVFLSMEDYVIQINTAPPPSLSNPHHHHHPPSRNKLKTCLITLGFDEVDLCELIQKEGIETQEMEKKTVLSKHFHDCVIRRCKEQTTVFLHVAGNTMRKEESVVMEELMQLVQLLPTSMVTMVIDCHEASTKETPWAELTKWNSRAVIFSVCYASSQKSGNSPSNPPSNPYGRLTELFVKAFEAWLSRGSPSMFTHRLLYEQMSYWWYGQREQILFSPSIQGDVDRTFLGGDGYPYHQWLRADLMSNKSPSSPRERFDLARVQLRTSKMAGLIIGDVLDVFHICRPEKVFKGRVVEAHQMCAIVAMENVEALAQLLEEEYRDIPPGRDSSMDFLCWRKSFPLHVKKDYTVFLDLGEDDCSKLKHHINTSPLLTVVDSSQDVKIVVKKEGQAYTIEDHCGDVTYRPKVKDIVHVPSLLEMMAWFKFVKAIHPDPPHISPAYSCFLTSSGHLPLLSDNSNIRLSSHEGDPTAAPIFCSGKEGSYWKPSYTDRNPYMCINLSSNCVVTAVEIKVGGESNSHDNEVQVQLQYCEAAFSKEFVCTDKSVLSLELQAKSLVLSVSLERSMPSKEEDRLWDLQFFSTQGVPIQIGGNGSKIAWREVKSDFFLGQLPQDLTKLEIRAPQGSITGKVKVTLHSSFVPLCKVVAKTRGFPKLCQLDTPVVASMVLLTPVAPRDGSPVSLQVQLYGMKDRGMVEVEEGKKVAFRFTNHSPYDVCVTVLCLEETGKIQLLLREIAATNAHINTSIITSIPKEHNVPAITDTYKVFVSRKMMYLEPYIQRGLHDHFSPLHYDVCSRDEDKPDWWVMESDLWDQYEFKVRIRRASTY
ncbi:hypothetical protein EMCRGX_G033863 [Ephydatia muelleri]